MPWLKTTKTAKKINKKYLRYWWRWGSPVWTHSCCHCSRLRCKSAYSSSSHLDTSWQPKGQVKWRFNWTNTTRTFESNTSQAERKGPIACRGRRWSGICVSMHTISFWSCSRLYWLTHLSMQQDSLLLPIATHLGGDVCLLLLHQQEKRTKIWCRLVHAVQVT